jgi:hypothetical protein
MVSTGDSHDHAHMLKEGKRPGDAILGLRGLWKALYELAE